MKKLLYTLTTLVLISCIHAQQPALYSIHFDKGNVNWQWQGKLVYLKRWFNWQLAIQESFQSNLYRGLTQNQNWKDLNDFQVYLQRQFRGPLKWQGGIKSRVLSDQTTDLRFSQHTAYQKLIWQVRQGVELAPVIGWSWEESFGFGDNGLYSGLEFQIKDVDLGGYRTASRISGNYKAFPERKNRDYQIFTSFYRQFSPQASDSLMVRFSTGVNRYYLSAAGALESVSLQEQSISNLLNYAFSSHQKLQIRTRFQKRNLAIVNPFSENQRNEVVLNNRIVHQAQWKKVKFNTEIHTAQKIQDNTGIETDINGVETGFGFGIEYQLSSQLQAVGNFRYTKYEFNTPDTVVNHDDRDEQRFIMDATLRWRISPYLTAVLNGYAYLFHQVYIHRTRSANNNWNRIFRIQAYLIHTPSPKLNHKLKAEVLANYTIYDFDEILPVFKSYIFRKFIAEDSLRFEMGGGFNLQTFYRLELEDNGTFFKTLFAQQVSQKINVHFVNVIVEYRTFFNIRVAVGGNVYKRDEWRFRPEAQQTRAFVSFSLILQIRYSHPRRMQLFMEYAPTRVTDFGVLTQRFSNARIVVQYHF